MDKNSHERSQNMIMKISGSLIKTFIKKKMTDNEYLKNALEAAADRIDGIAGEKLSGVIDKLCEDNSYATKFEKIYGDQYSNLNISDDQRRDIDSLLSYTVENNDKGFSKQAVYDSFDNWKENNGSGLHITKSEMQRIIGNLFNNIESAIAKDNDLQEYWKILGIEENVLKVLGEAAEIHNDTTKIINVQNEHGQKLDELLSRTDNLITPTIEESLLSIIDNNKEFSEKFTDSENAFLFLDKESGIYLSDVYVDPFVTGDQMIDELLETWSKPFDPVTREKQEKVLLLCGNAGIGKTSLVAKLIYNDFFKGKAHAVFLRKKKDCFDNGNPWESVKRAFGCDDDRCYSDKVLILDGFDELCVLNNNFDGHRFLVDLSRSIPNEVKNVRILITSRDNKGYFYRVITETDIICVENLKWKKAEAFKWCDKYYSAKSKWDKESEPAIKNWVDNFKNSYPKIDNKLKKSFCVPIILYICCHENIDISHNQSIVEIYDKAFKSIASRTHDKDFVSGLNISDEQCAVILWQLTKEISYQMCLHDTLYSAANTKLITNAKIRVRANLNRNDLTDEVLDKMLEKLPAIFYFSSVDEKGIEFAHKTVAEYFTAVKLYEDYLAWITDDTPEDEETLEEVWINIIEAFRYKKIPFEVFGHLISMSEPVYDGKVRNENKPFDYKKFERFFIEGMKKNILSNIPISKPIKEYNYLHDVIPAQIGLAFRNLTWFLSFNGYCNKENIDECKNFKYIISSKYSDLQLCNWNLNGAFLPRANLRKADLTDAYLIRAHLREVNLTLANLTGADLTGANLIGANLNLIVLNRTNLSEAQYCRQSPFVTQFPNKFNPEEHGMIEVDIGGNPIEE